MSVATECLQQSTVAQYCKLLRLPTVAGQCSQLAEQAEREHHTYLAYLEALLIAEVEERERRVVGRRLMEAHLPRIKTLDEFDFSQTPSVSAANIAMLAEGGYIERAEPVVFIGDSGTGKTHLLTGLCVAACRQKRRVRFTTAANLVNELAEKAAVILTTNLPFSEWTQVLPNARRCSTESPTRPTSSRLAPNPTASGAPWTGGGERGNPLSPPHSEIQHLTRLTPSTQGWAIPDYQSGPFGVVKNIWPVQRGEPLRRKS